MVNGTVPGPTYYNDSRIPETDSRDPENETWSLEIDLRVYRKHDTLETGLQIIPRSLVGQADIRVAVLRKLTYPNVTRWQIEGNSYNIS